MPNLAECDELAKGVGFRDTWQFLDYCDSHSRTQRALFNGPQIGLAQICAGYEEVGKENMRYSDNWKSCDLTDLVAKARERLREDSDHV